MENAQTSTIESELSSIVGDAKKFYVDGRWVDPQSAETLDVINPATEKPIATIALGGAGDVDRAVAAARMAFDSF